MTPKTDPYATKTQKRVDAFLIAFIILAILLLLRPAARADQNWDGDNAVGNFSFANNWFGDTVGGNSGFGFGNGSLHFSLRNNGSQSSIFYDFAGFADTNDIIWDSSFNAGLTFDGNGQGLNFNQRLENDSSFTQTIGASMNLSGAKNGATQIELNPVNGDLVLNGNIFNDNSKPYVVFGANSKTLTVNTTLGVGGNAAAVSFTLNGNSTVKMTATQAYGNGTNVNAGTLLVNAGSGATSGTGTGAVIVNNSGTFGGTGRIAGATTINAGAKITGATVGTVGTLTLASTATFSGASGNLAQYLVDISGTTSDRLTIGGALNLSGTFDQISFSGSADGTSSYILATYGSLNGTFDAVTNLPSGYQLVYGLTELDLTPVPEPATWLGGALALGALAYSQRRRLRALVRPQRAA